MDASFIRRLASFWKRRPDSSALSQPDPSLPVTKAPGFALEPRIMLDAAIVSTGAEVLEDTGTQPSQEQQTPPPATTQPSKDELAEALEAFNPPAISKEVLLIDPSVPDYETLLAGIPENAQVHILSSSASLEEIAGVLSSYQNLDAVHIISHGSTGSLSLSGETVNSASLESQRETLAVIGQSLSEEGDILLYGCNVGSDGEGQAFIEQLAELTGADVAASDDLTGSSDFGGDWELEASSGMIGSDTAFTELSANTYRSVLGEIVNGGVGAATTNGTSAGQVFTATETGVISEIHVVQSNQSDGVGQPVPGPGAVTLTLTIYDGIGTGGTVLHTQQVNLVDSAIDAATYTFQAIEIDAAVNIVSGNQYSFELTGGAAGGTQVNLLYETTKNYPGGDIVFGGAVNPAGDLIFKVVQGPAAVANTDPSISIDDATLPYIEDNAAIQVDAAATVNDDDGDADWDGGTLTAQITANNEAADRLSISDTDGDGTAITVSGTNILANGTDIGDLSSSGGTVTNGTALTITFDSDATNAIVQEVLRSLRYDNTSDNPGTSNRTITITATDNDSGTNNDTRTVSVAAQNDAPTNSGTLPASATVTEDIAGNLDLSASNFADVDSAGTVDVILTASSGTLTASSGSIGITGSGTGTLTLTDTFANINTFLNTASSVQYTGASNVSGNGAATITVTANDNNGSGNVNLGTVSVNITPVNDVPVVSEIDGDSLTYNEDDGAVVLDQGSALTLVDIDSSDFNGGAMAASIQGGKVSGEDVLSFDTSGAVSLDGTTAGSNVRVSGTIVGTLDSDIAAGNDLFVSLVTDANASNIQTLMRAVTYENINTANPSTGARTIALAASDGDGGDSSLSTVTVTVAAVNDAPVLDANQSPTLTGINEDVPGASNTGTTVADIIVNGSITDPDGSPVEAIAVTSVDNTNGVWQYFDSSWQNFSATTGQVVNIAASARLLDSTHTVRFVPDANWNGNATLTFRAWDKSAGSAGGTADASSGGGSSAFSSATDTAQITVSAVNDVPGVNADPDNSSGGAPGFETTFAAGSSSGVAVVDSDFTITDIDDTHIESAVISLSGDSDSPSESISIEGLGPSPATSGAITVTYTATQINLSGSATKADYEALIKQIRYGNSEASADATTGDRTVTISVNDGEDPSNSELATISVVSAPVVDTGPGKTYTENDGNTPVLVIDSSATITDSDSANLSQMVINNSNAKAGDRITLAGRNNSDAVNGITITYNNVNQITLSGSATKAEYLSLLKELQFDNNSQNPDTTDRNISIATTDTDGNTGTTGTTVAVQGTNDAPVATNDTGAVNEDATLTVTQANGVVDNNDTDVDGDTVTVSAIRTGTEAGSGTGGTVGSTLTGTYGTLTLNADGSYSYVADQAAADALALNATATDTFTYTLRDGKGGTDTAEIVITVTGSNDTPAIQVVDVTGTIEEGSTLNDSGSVTFTDLDLTDRPVATEATKSVTPSGITLTTDQRTAIENAFTITNAGGNTHDGTVTWDYTITEGELNF
ncbi:MAG: DUF4347 domain-containing protein, partial [Endozoicomonas sp.]